MCIDTIAWFSAEGPSWQDEKMAPAEWDTVGVPPGSCRWWLAFGGQGGSVYKAWDSDPMTGKYLPNMDDRLISPKIARVDLDTNFTNLWLNYCLRGQIDDDDLYPNIDYVSNEYRVDGGEWQYINTLHGIHYRFVFWNFDDSDWWKMDEWPDSFWDLTPLLSDTVAWDTLEVCIHFHSDDDQPGPSNVGLQVDNVTIIGFGYPNDLGVTAAQLPSPNANDVKLFMDTLAVENYGFLTASSGAYFVKMTIVDSNGTVVFGPGTIISDLFPPAIEPMQTALVPLNDAVCNFTLTEEGVYDFFIWTEWSDTTDHDPSNDTLRTEYTLKDLWY
ncbi:hypothetical protein KAU04_04500, partial [bacterium]|nr:hypothetical protein [bacterium]